MTPIKTGGTQKKGFFAAGGGPGTATVSGMMASVDGEEFEYHMNNSERDDDNLTLKTSEYRLQEN